MRWSGRGSIWADAEESLGDYWWMRRDSRNWSQAAAYYQNAWGWWARSQNIELARSRYLNIIWKAARPQFADPYYHYGYYGNLVPLEILENGLRIAQSGNDVTYLHYLIAVNLSRQGDMSLQQKIPDEFEAALKTGKQSEWYDDALYQYAQWLSNRGRAILQENGQWKIEPDFPKALEMYGRIVREFNKGSTRYYDDSLQQIKIISSPSLSVSVSNIFLPDSEIQYHLNWRNLKQVQFALYKIDLTNDMAFSKDANTGAWIQQIQTVGKSPVKSWTKQTEDKGQYFPGQETARLDSNLAVGAYLIEAKGTEVTARDLILVSDVSLVIKTSGRQALAYFCNSGTGAPIGSANIQLWEQNYDGNNYFWRASTKTSNQDGIAVFELSKLRSHQIFAAAKINDKQAFSSGYNYSQNDLQANWRIYAFTDRPAYRPEDTVKWKFVARQYKDFVYSTPSNQAVEFEITDPQGSVVKTDKAQLNAFGSAWGSLDLKPEMPLGEYRIQFWNEGRKDGIGYATLFRLEEYKLPEFKVSIQTPEEEGKKKIFRVGERVEISVQADYYFGGPVPDAEVEVVVYQNEFYRWWEPPHEFPWLYRDRIQVPEYDYGGQEIVKKTIV